MSKLTGAAVDGNAVEIHLTEITPETNGNLFFTVNGEYVGSLWFHKGEVTWGAHDEIAGDWIPRTTLVWAAREHRHEFQGQALVHAHPHQGAHGYFDHVEDVGAPEEPGYDTDVPYLDLSR